MAEVLDPDPRRRVDPVVALRLLAAAGRGDPHATVVPVLVALAEAPPPVPAAEAHAWAETFRRVRPRLAQALEALGARVSGTFGQGWGAHWTGRPVPGSAGLPGAARALVVWLGVDDAEPAGRATGVLDLWHETLPGALVGRAGRRERRAERPGDGGVRVQRPRGPPAAGDPPGGSAHPGRASGRCPAPARPGPDPASAPGSAVIEAAARDWAGAAGTADPFDTSQFAYTTELVGGGARFLARQHPGGPTDWWSADVAGQFHAAGPTRTAAGVPGRMRYPGAPAPGWCTLEDPRESVTAHLPDTAHVGSLFFLDLLAGHATDWYLFPLPTPPGRVLSVRAVTVTDSFGDTWRLPDSAWGPPQRWSLFRTSGLSATDLLVWPADHPPLAGPVLERVVLGVDEDANLLWAVEDIVEGGGPLPDAPADAAVPADNVAPAVAYQPLGEPPPRWHPYPADDAAEPRRFRAGRLATRADPGLTTPLPDPGSRILRSDTVHLIDPAAVPAAGLAVERRWVLGRSADGSPALWQERSRRVPAAPPALRLPFDVVGPA